MRPATPENNSTGHLLRQLKTAHVYVHQAEAAVVQYNQVHLLKCCT